MKRKLTALMLATMTAAAAGASWSSGAHAASWSSKGTPHLQKPVLVQGPGVPSVSVDGFVPRGWTGTLTLDGVGGELVTDSAPNGGHLNAASPCDETASGTFEWEAVLTYHNPGSPDRTIKKFALLACR
jgi:hypothetical protein